VCNHTSSSNSRCRTSYSDCPTALLVHCHFRNTYTSTLLLKSTPLATHGSSIAERDLFKESSLFGGCFLPPPIDDDPREKYECMDCDGNPPSLERRETLLLGALLLDVAVVVVVTELSATSSFDMECVLEFMEYLDGLIILDTD